MCYVATEIAEILLLFFLPIHILYWGWSPSDSQELSFFFFHFLSITPSSAIHGLTILKTNSVLNLWLLER